MTLDQKIRHLNHRRIDLSRALILKLTAALVSGFSRFYPSQDRRSILILRLDNKLGDSISSTGFLRELKKAFPAQKLVVVAGASTFDLYSRLSFVDSVLVGKKGFFKNLFLYFKLRKNSFDFIVNTSHILNPRTLFLTAFLKAYKKISFSNTPDKIFSDHLQIDFKNQHVTARYRQALHVMGVPHVNQLNLAYEITKHENSADEATGFVRNWKEAGFKLVLLNSFAGGRLRNLSEVTTKAIVKLLLQNPKVIVISVANRGDHDILSRWLQNESTERWVHFPQLSSLNQNLALAEACDLILTPDTSWVHIASALQKKLVAIYRQDRDPAENNSVIWAPYGTIYRLIYSKSAADSVDDINDIEPQAVVSEVLDLLFKN